MRYIKRYFFKPMHGKMRLQKAFRTNDTYIIILHQRETIINLYQGVLILISTDRCQGIVYL